MLRSRAAGDEEQFFTIALQIAAAEARQGHRSVAEGLREAVEKARANSGRGQTVAVPFATPRGDLADIIELRSLSHRLDDVVLNSSLRGQLDGLIREQARRDWLREHGKTPSRRILFVGPPGSGKTMTAEALAGALKLPLFVIRLEALITRFMGETAAKLRLVFDETAKRRGVYLFDEFDAVGGHRSASNDVAEMRGARGPVKRPPAQVAQCPGGDSDRHSCAEPICDAVVHPLCWSGLGSRVVSGLAEKHGPQPCAGGFGQENLGAFF